MKTQPSTMLIQGTGGYFAIRNVTIFVQAQYPEIIADASMDGMQFCSFAEGAFAR